MAAPDDTPPPAKHILFNDRRTGVAFVMEIPPESPWHELLPQHQETEIRAVSGSTPRP